MKSYLKHFRVLQQQLETKRHMKEAMVGWSTRSDESQRNQPAPSWEEAFESLRGSSTNRTMSGKNREDVAVSRSYEGIMQKRASSTAELPSYVEMEEPRRYSSTNIYHSSENIPSAATPHQQWQRSTAIASHKQDYKHQVEPRSQRPVGRTRPRPLSEADFGLSGGGSTSSLPAYRKHSADSQHRRALMYQPVHQPQQYHHSQHRHSYQDLSHRSGSYTPDIQGSRRGDSEGQPPPLPKSQPPSSVPQEAPDSSSAGTPFPHQSSPHKGAPRKLVQTASRHSGVGEMSGGEETTPLELAANMEELDTKVTQLALLVSKERQELLRRLLDARKYTIIGSKAPYTIMQSSTHYIIFTCIFCMCGLLRYGNENRCFRSEL